MKLLKLSLLLTLLGILIITLVSQAPQTLTATIKSIQQSDSETTIKLENKSTELIIFDNINLNLKQGDQIKFQGKPDTYKNQKQIIVSKISKL